MTSSFLNSSWPVTLIDAAFRSLLMAAGVGLGLGLLRVNNVRARKVAWMLVLSAAITMPVVAPWAESQAWLPIHAAEVPVQKWIERVAAWGQTAKPQIANQPSPSHSSIEPLTSKTVEAPTVLVAQQHDAAVLGSDHFPSPAISMNDASRNSVEARSSVPLRSTLSLSQLALLIYCTIAAALLARLAVGLIIAIRLWINAEPVKCGSGVGATMRVRSSRGASSPVTVGSGILLPARYTCWDAEKLRIVLAHESSHVRQGDFYLQLCAAIYAALFWFSPLGWWLKRTLCDLSEAVSDGEAVSQAASHASYAQVLLEFAAMPRTARIGVAMARQGRLSHRIERLLDEGRFHRAFAGGRARMLLAALLAPVALIAATSLIRVQAAGQAPAPVPQTPAVPELPTTQALPTAPESPTASSGPATTPVPPAPLAAPAAPSVLPSPPASGVELYVGASASELSSMASSQSDARGNRSHGSGSSHSANGQHYNYSYSDNGESYALISGNDKQHVQFSGDWMEGRREQLDKARSKAHGDFLWFTRDSKSYIVDDPTIVADLISAYKPMEDLGKQQEALGQQQEELGRQQEKLSERMGEATIPTPDIAKEMADLNAAVASLNAAKGKTVTQEQLSELEAKLSEVQGKIGGLQGELGAREGEIGALQGKLGSQQGELGGRQGRIGAEQGRIAREADRKVKSVIDQSLKNGKARPVE